MLVAVWWSECISTDKWVSSTTRICKTEVAGDAQLHHDRIAYSVTPNGTQKVIAILRNVSWCLRGIECSSSSRQHCKYAYLLLPISRAWRCMGWHVANRHTALNLLYCTTLHHTLCTAVHCSTPTVHCTALHHITPSVLHQTTSTVQNHTHSPVDLPTLCMNSSIN